MSRHLLKEEIQRPEKIHEKKISIPLTIRQMQIKTTVRSHQTPVSMGTVKNAEDSEEGD